MTEGAFAMVGPARRFFPEFARIAALAEKGGGVYYYAEPEYVHPGPWWYTVYRYAVHRHGVKTTILDPARSRKLLDLSPDFSCGYGGASRGTKQLALAIILDATGSKADAIRYYEEYAARFLADIKVFINGEQVEKFIREKKKHISGI